MELAECGRRFHVFGVGDQDRDVVELEGFFFNEALVRPLCCEFFEDWLCDLVFDFFFVEFECSSLDLRLWISRERLKTAFDVDLAISSSSS